MREGYKYCRVMEMAYFGQAHKKVDPFTQNPVQHK